MELQQQEMYKSMLTSLAFVPSAFPYTSPQFRAVRLMLPGCSIVTFAFTTISLLEK